jgi:serine-type D-Ala-D-Ala carboxypeptidase (penicillin-binding protein 5/6)
VHDYSRRPANYGPLILGVLLVLFVVAVAQVLRGAPDPEFTITFPASSPLGEPRQPRLPEDGASIVAATGLGVIGSAGSTEPRPIASITKMMTAHVILKDHPLNPGETGPIVELTTADEERWLEMVAQDQSSLPVYAGQRLTQLQLLQGLLVPSANNYSEILAAWDAGSVAAFVDKMNAEADALGMKDSTYTDTSGFSPGTVSTAADQLILARAAMQDPVFASIVRQEEITIPGVGTVSSVNSLLGVDGIVGIKTGFTEQAGGNLAFAAIRDIAGQQVDLYGVILGQGDGIDGFESRQEAFAATQTVIHDLDAGLEYRLVISNRQPMATVTTDWGDEVDLVITEDVELLTWPGVTMQTTVQVEDISPGKSAGDQVGWVNVIIGEQGRRLPLVLATDLKGPGIFWRLTRF